MFRINGFYGHVRRNDLYSVVLFAGFLVAFELVGALAAVLPTLMYDFDHLPVLYPVAYLGRWGLPILGVGAVVFGVQFARHKRSVRSSLPYRLVTRADERRLFDIVQTQAIAAGLPPPGVGVLETSARNAFACGLDARSAVVVVTRGLLTALDDDELGAVVAHELAHIRNGDIRLVAAAAVLVDTLHWLQRQNPLRIEGPRQVVLMVLVPPMLLVLLAASFVSWMAFTLARASRLLIANAREFVADAEAVQMTQNPAALISALRKIEGFSALPGIDARRDAMMIDGAVSGPFASHPPVAARIAVLLRLSGDLATITLARKDTRDTAPEPDWRAAYRPEPEPDRGSALQRVIARVNAGARETMLGMTRRLWWQLALGAGFLFCVQVMPLAGGRQTVLGGFFGGADVSPLEFASNLFGSIRDEMTGAARQEATGASWDDKRLGAGTFGIAAGPDAWKKLQRLAAQDPGLARCFTTDFYTVGERGLHAVATPDPALVEAFIAGARGPDIVLERYLANQTKAVAAVAAAVSEGRMDPALLNYVDQRKLMLKTVHWFFGTPGLAVMQAGYDRPSHRTVLEMIRGRLEARAPMMVADPHVAAELAFLVDAPADFMPCRARLAL